MLTKEQKEKSVQEGSLRLMTLGEMAMAREIFGHSIVYSRVWVHCDSYFPGGLQGKYVGMSPNGEIYFRKELYKADFSSAEAKIENRHTFIHELAHVWQFQKGMWVRIRGLVSWAVKYTYNLDGANKLNVYPMEQQAQIIGSLKSMVILSGMSSVANMVLLRIQEKPEGVMLCHCTIKFYSIF